MTKKNIYRTLGAFFLRTLVYILTASIFLSIIILGGVLLISKTALDYDIVARHISSKNNCTISKGEISAVRFEGHKLYIPTAYVKKCEPEIKDHEWSEPYIILSATLPHFLPDGKNTKEGPILENEVRVFFHGLHTFEYDIRKRESTDLEINFLERINSGVYGHAEPSDFALTKYAYRSTNPFEGDLYVHKDQDGKIDFMIECHASKFCTSISERFYSNVNYSYSFHPENLSQVTEIDRWAKNMARNIQKP
ncbi:MAG: hypothetical protein ACXW4B_09160 [Micavibrio sp.]